MRRVLVAGLDCAAPSLMFDRFLEDLPNVKSLIKSGVYGRLRSCDPPITVPAWMVMATGRSPGSLGLYGFRYRRYGEYRKFSIASSKSILVPKIWDIVGRHGGKSCVFAVPPSYPPTRVEGCLVSCFLTPSSKVDYTYPSDLKPELEEAAGEYVPDVLFRTEEKDKLLGELWDMTEQHMKAIMYLLENKQWDFFMFVEIGLDRVQHAFWKYFDEKHHLHVPDSKFKTVVRDYYRMLDKFLGEILDALDRDTVLLVVSDHGAKAMKGAFSVNDWLMRMGYLKVKGRPEPGVRIGEAEVDWEKTVAWGWGGYYARIFLNVEGREPEGTVKPSEYERVRDKLAHDLKQIRGPNGEPWRTRVLKPDRIFKVCRGYPPDLMVYFDDLYWRSAGTFGYENPYLPENDTGPDDAVHDYHGVFVLYDPKGRRRGVRAEMNIMDVAPTVLRIMGLPVPEGVEGRVVEEVL